MPQNLCYCHVQHAAEVLLYLIFPGCKRSELMSKVSLIYIGCQPRCHSRLIQERCDQHAEVESSARFSSGAAGWVLNRELRALGDRSGLRLVKVTTQDLHVFFSLVSHR